jgi:streptogramin lyase
MGLFRVVRGVASSKTDAALFALFSAALLPLAGCVSYSNPTSAVLLPNRNSHANTSLLEPSPSPLPKVRIYVANLVNNTVTTYKTNGERTVPTIRAGISAPREVAVDARGNIYVVNNRSNSVTTYKPNGVRTKPTITDLHSPIGIAIDAAGNIYIANYGNDSITTYSPLGKRIKPTITSGLAGPYGVSVDNRGEIYVSNFLGNRITTYGPDGTREPLTINHLHQPTGIAFGYKDRLSVASFQDSMVLTYQTAKLSHPIISTGIQEPCFISVDPDYDIYVANYAPPPPNTSGEITVYSKRGIPSKVTITAGLDGPVGIAFWPTKSR